MARRTAEEASAAYPSAPTASAYSWVTVNVHQGVYGSVPIDVIMQKKKSVDVEKYYNTDRLRPRYETFGGKPVFIMTSDV